ncbi:MAG: type III pantothenate kinase [Flavobacteriales bacterium]|nr:type III pantothenate kinase [Flavobacteriales bacterium]MCB9197782.1 type III pantothenate kinase [Flavobacteriales bacterium]
MNVIVDIGNTRTKIAWFEEDELIAVDFAINMESIAELLFEKKIDNCIISSVANEELTKFVISLFQHPVVLDSVTDLPITNAYRTPETLGKDRLANAVGAYLLFNNTNTLIVDAGTCLKFDFIDSSNSYLGGSIAPGLRMRFKAVHTFTDKLPLVEPEQMDAISLGDDTSSSIHAGCYMGMKNEIEATIQQYRLKYNGLKVIITGGDMEELQKMEFSQKNSIFADRWLTLRGLNKILRHNVES